MTSTFGKVVGDLTISAPLDLFGQATGSLTIAAGGSLSLHGQVAGNVIVLAGGYADLQGQVGGNVENRGGKITIGGLVVGKLISLDGETQVLPAAIILAQT